MTKLSELRRAAGLSASEAAEFLQLPPDVIAAYEAGTLVTPPRVLQAFKGLVISVSKRRHTWQDSESETMYRKSKTPGGARFKNLPSELQTQRAHIAGLGTKMKMERNAPAMARYRVVSLFSGAMGLDIGLEKTGRFQIVACVEKEKAFCDTIRANLAAGRLHKDTKVFEGDITDIGPDRLMAACGIAPGDIDLVIGGPPCQSFSTVGKRRTTQDPRGTLLWQFLRYVEALQPKFFPMENVRGLLSAALLHRPISSRPEKGGPPLMAEEAPGSVVRLFADDLQTISGRPYHMDCFEVNAVNYGAPQLRERAIFIGNRFNAVVDFPDPTHSNPASSNDPSLFADGNNLLPWRTLGDAIRNMNAAGDVIMDFSPRKKSFLSLVPAGSNWRSLPEEVQRKSMGTAWHAKGGRSGWWRRLSFDLPSPTLVTMPNHASTSLCHPSEVRALTLREYAAIQEFPAE
jgi:DNA (cytosine-5)-methyltransferase 1